MSAKTRGDPLKWCQEFEIYTSSNVSSYSSEGFRVFAAQGSKEARLDGAEHMAALEEFCMAAKKRYPNCLVQFEDFPTDKVRNCIKLNNTRVASKSCYEV